MGFPSLPPSLQQTALRVEVLKNRGEPDPSPHGWSPPASLQEGDIQRFTPCCLCNPNFSSTLQEVLEGKLIVRLEAVREPGPGGGWSIQEVTFDPR